MRRATAERPAAACAPDGAVGGGLAATAPTAIAAGTEQGAGENSRHASPWGGVGNSPPFFRSPPFTSVIVRFFHFPFYPGNG
jgi:hypothetical protein